MKKSRCVRKANPRKQVRKRFAGCYTVGQGRIRRRKVNRKAVKKKPFSGCYTVGQGRIRRRKVNPFTRYYIFARARKGWLRYSMDGNFHPQSKLHQARDWATREQATGFMEALVEHYPKELGERELEVRTKW